MSEQIPASSQLGIAEAHLNKVIHQLGLAGGIETIRRRGTRLARLAQAA